MVPAIALLSASKHPCPNAGRTLLSSEHNLSPCRSPSAAAGEQEGARGQRRPHYRLHLLLIWARSLTTTTNPVEDKQGQEQQTVGTGISTRWRFTAPPAPAQAVQPEADTWTVAHSHPLAAEAGQKDDSKPQT